MEQDEAREPVEKEVRLLVPIEKGDSPQRVTYGVVLEPDSEDLQGDVMTAEDIEQAAYDWMERSQQGGHMHAALVESATVVESYIAPCDITVETADRTETIRKGSWVLAMRWPPEIWESIQKGRLTGYSVGGTGVRLEIEKHGSHDQSEHGNWARGGYRGDPARDGAAAEGGGTPAGQGAAAARSEGRKVTVARGQQVQVGDMVEHLNLSRPAKVVAVNEDGSIEIDLMNGGKPGGQTKTVPVNFLAQFRTPVKHVPTPPDPLLEAAHGPLPAGRPSAATQAMLDDPDLADHWAQSLQERAGGQVKKHGSHDQSSHGNWARDGMTPAEEGNVAGRAERARASAKDAYAKETLRSFDLVDDIEERLQDMQAPGDDFRPTWEQAGTAEEIDTRLGAVLGFLTGDEDAYAQAQGTPPKLKTAEDAYSARMLSAFDRVEEIRDLLQDQPAPSDDFTPNWEHAGSAEEVSRRLNEVQSLLGGSPNVNTSPRGRTHFWSAKPRRGFKEPTPPTGNTYFWSAKRAGPEISAESLASAVRGGLRDALTKHGSHDQREHGNWARRAPRRLMYGRAREGDRVLVFRGSGRPFRVTVLAMNADGDITRYRTADGEEVKDDPIRIRDSEYHILQNAVAKHGSHDQSTHGNWARDGYPSGTVDDEEMYPTGGKWQGEDDDEVDMLDLFEESRGATVTLDGHAYTVKEIKPFKHVPGLDSVMLEPKDKNSAWYRDERAKLHDDWDLEVSDPERLVELAQQLPGWGRPEGISKHGSGDQSPHGNWARSKELGMVTVPEDDDSPARPEDEERDEDLRRWRAQQKPKHTTRDGVTIEDQPKVQRLGGEMFASADGRVQLNYGEWKWTSAGQSRGVAKPPKLHERGRWGVWPRGADRSDTSKVIWGSGKTLAEFINSLDPGEYDLAT